MIDDLVLVVMHRERWINNMMNNSSSFLGWFGMVAWEPDLLVACVALIALHPTNILGLTALLLLSRLTYLNLDICWTFAAINPSFKPNMPINTTRSGHSKKGDLVSF
jgi:hypothetical protein